MNLLIAEPLPRHDESDHESAKCGVWLAYAARINASRLFPQI